MTMNTYIVAELSANHNGSLSLAKETILAAKNAGADAVKIQTYTADTITMNCGNDCFQIAKGSSWEGRSLYQLYEEAHTPWEWHPELKRYADELGIPIFSTPFDVTAVDFLEQFDLPFYKIASFEAVDIPLIKYAASKSKPMIISTGICNIEDIENALDACYSVGNHDVTLLKCTSSYPAPLKSMNLRTILDIKKRWGVKVGLSDHTLGMEAALTATALGATMIEKHFVIDRSTDTVDASFSMEPKEFELMIKAIRRVECLLGDISYHVDDNSRRYARSLFAVENIAKDSFFTKDNIRSIRPANGLSPKHYDNILGSKAAVDISRGTPLSWNVISS